MSVKVSSTAFCRGRRQRNIQFIARDKTGQDFAGAGNAFKTYFQPSQKYFEHQIFSCCAKQEAESIDSYITRLRTLARTCQFDSVDEELIHKSLRMLIQ